LNAEAVLSRSEAVAAPPGDPRAPGRALLACVGALAGIGLIAAVSAAPPGEAGQAIGMHCAHLALGLSAFLFGFLLNPDLARRLVGPALILLLLFLTLMLVSGIGHSSHEATRWIRIGSFSFQPSLLYQCLWPVALASWVVRDPLRLSQMRALARLGGVFLLLMLPVFLQPDLGSVAILMFGTGVTLMFAGAPMRFLWCVAGVGVLSIALAALVFPHVGDRLDWWIEPEDQVVRGMEAMAAAGPLGRGPGMGVMKHGHVPEGRTDFVLTVIGEEWGLLGTLSVWSLFVAFTLIGFAVARRAATRYGVILMASATVMVSVQAAYNMAMVYGLVPVKGLPLPFVSRGGSSIVALAALLGLALQASYRPKRPPAPATTLLP
jgi:cell division protein FtsW